MTDTKCSFPNSKCKKPDSSTFNSDGSNEDENLLRRPLGTSSDGFREAKEAYENGTDEVRRLLMQECSLIYECNVCRNMFRSLANFINHKRNYCKTTTADYFQSYLNPSSSVFVQNVEKSEIKSRSTGSSPIPNTKSSNCDLTKVIERLKGVEVSPNNSHDKTLTEDYKMDVSSPEPKITDRVLELERISTTTHDAYQTLKMKNATASIKIELDRVQNLPLNQKNLFGPDGKTIASPSKKSISSLAVNDTKGLDENNYKVSQLSAQISCEICKLTFRTEKLLKIHVQKKHTSTTYVFQCPTCSMKFMQPASVIRHLANEHRKPLRRLRKIRDTILKKRIQIGDVHIKGLGREVKRLQITNTKDLYSCNTMDKQNARSTTSCTYCFRNFERRAALATHLASCLARKTSLEINVLSEDNQKATIQSQIFNQHLEDSHGNVKIVNGEIESNEINIQQIPQKEQNSTTNSSNINKLFENLENQTFGNGLKTVSLEKIQLMAELMERNNEEKEKSNDEDIKGYEPSNEKQMKDNDMINKYSAAKKEKNKHFRIVSTSKQLTCRCKICNKQFNALSNLRRHISMFHYRSRRFGCNLCDYRAFRRYDIVNHLTFVHKMTGERESMAVEYVTVHEIKYSKDDVEGDIVVVNDEAIVSEQNKTMEQQQIGKESNAFKTEIALKSYEKKEKTKKVLLQTKKDILPQPKVDSPASKDKSHIKVISRKLKKSFEQQLEHKKRPIRNRVKTVNNDFVYDILTIKEESKESSRLTFKRRNINSVDQNVDFTSPPIKITPYRLRTEPLMPSDENNVKGVAANICRNVINEGLAAPSTLPEMPTERPQMRPRLISSLRSDSNTVPIIETSELEAAGLKSTFFDDSFLEKFAKKSNPSFKMKPLLALQHSPLNSILQKFDASQQNNINKTENNTYQKCPENNNNSPPNYTVCLLESLKDKNVTPNGKQILDSSSPPATPKKRITLMQRLAENRAKIRDNLIRTALEN